MRFKWQTILQHGGRMLRARGWCSASRGWAGAAGWTHSAHEAGPKAVQGFNAEVTEFILFLPKLFLCDSYTKS